MIDEAWSPLPDEDIAVIVGGPNDRHATCRQINGRCIGYHCPWCDKAVGPQGHDCPLLEALHPWFDDG